MSKHIRYRVGVPIAGGVLLASMVATGSVAASASVHHTSSPTVITEEDPYTYPASTVMTQLVDEFNKTHPGYEVKRTVVPDEDMLTKLLHQASANSLPDVIAVDEQWLPEMAAGNTLVPVKQLGFNPSTINSGAKAVGEYNGTLYGAAVANNSLGLVYDKKMFAAAHLQPPKTWAQLESDAKKLTTKSVYGFAIGLGQNAPADWQFEPFFWTAGGSLTKVNNAGGVASLTLLANMVKDGSVSRSAASWTQSDAAEQFADGHAAMVDTGPWEIPAFKSVDWGAETMPTPKAGETAISPVGGPVWSVSKSSTAQEKAAWTFVSWLLQPTQELKFAVANDDVPALKSLDASIVKKYPDIALFAKSTETGRSRTAQVGVHYNAIAQALTNALESAVLGEKTPKAALDTAQTQVEQALKSNS